MTCPAMALSVGRTVDPGLSRALNLRTKEGSSINRTSSTSFISNHTVNTFSVKLKFKTLLLNCTFTSIPCVCKAIF